MSNKKSVSWKRFLENTAKGKHTGPAASMERRIPSSKEGFLQALVNEAFKPRTAESCYCFRPSME